MRIPLLCACLLAGAASAQSAIEAPLSGWRNTAGAVELYTQEVHYPAVSVNLQPGQSASAEIRGKIAGAAKGRPGTLIVNGVAIPVALDENGGYSRPYSFGRGSNGVEVRAPGAGSGARAQFFDAYAGKTESRLRIVLSWDSAATDLDLHVVTPDGGHAWYGARVLPNGGALDVDVTDGYGPEIFSSPTPPRGLYHVYVNYYGAGAERGALTTARLAIVTHENAPDEKQQVFLVPMRAPGELTLVKSFLYP